ncbi:MAG: META domain-containing protein [Bacteroidales bacterium]|nr:META domain-containing protein [Bacteroidales bacterium]
MTRKRVHIVLSAIASAVVLISCGSTGKAVSTADLNGEWTITGAMGSSISGSNGVRPSINFDTANSRVSGHSGCNRFMGGFTFNEDGKNSISFSPVAATKMMCPDIETEQKIFQALESAKKIQKNSSTSIVLRSENGKSVLELSRD